MDLPRFDTIQIGPHRALIEKLAERRIFLKGIAQFKVVVDVNMILPDLAYRARWPERGPTKLEELMASTVLIAHAPKWLEKEISSHLSTVSEQYSVDEAEIRKRWLAFRNLLIWHDTPLHPDNLDGGYRDPKDYPYIWLEKKLVADGILSKDRHIAQMGGHPLALEFVVTMRDYARAAVISSSIRIIGVSVSVASILIVGQLLRGISNATAALPPAAKAVLVALGVAAITHPDSRRWLVQRCVDLGAGMYSTYAAVTEIVAFLAHEDAKAEVSATVALATASAMVKPKQSAGRAYSRPRRRKQTRKALALDRGHLVRHPGKAY